MTSTVIALHLERAAQRLVARLETLESRLQDDQAAPWSEYAAIAQALAAILPTLAPGRHGELLTTKEMAARLAIAPKTLLKRKRAGVVRPALDLGRRGRAAVRWRGDEVGR
jgi:hypothetical protein